MKDDLSSAGPVETAALVLECVPQAMAARLTIVVPEAVDLEQVAKSHYDDAAWVHRPLTAEENRARTGPLTGARFRGIAATAEATPGVLRFGSVNQANGPYALTHRDQNRLGFRPGWAAYVLEEHASLPPVAGAARERTGPPMRSWARAVASRLAGALVTPAGELLRPDPRAVVGLQLFTAHAPEQNAVLAAVRAAYPGAQLDPSGTSDAYSYAIVARSSYDGDIVVRAERSDTMPLVLSTLPWREYGPFRYEVGWHSPFAGTDADDPGRISAIGRERMAPYIARIVLNLLEKAEGTVVTKDGFLIRAPELRSRAAGRIGPVDG